MPTLQIDGVGKVQVDDTFLKLSPADQNAFVAHVADQARQGARSGNGQAPASAQPSPGPAPLAFDDGTAGLADALNAPAPQPMSYGDQMRNVAGALGRGADDAVRVVADGMTLGLADRAAAGMDSLTRGGTYADNVAQERARTDAVGAGVPGLNTALKVGGGLLTGGGLARAGVGLAAKLPAAAPLIVRLAGFGADGGLFGAADAVGHKDSGSVSDFAKTAGQGAAYGAAFGAGLPLAGATLAKGAELAAPLLSPPIPGASRVTTGLLGALMSGRSLDSLDTLGPDATLADASPSLLGLAQGVASKPGPGADQVVDAFNARHAGQSDRLVADLNSNLGPALSPADVSGAMEAKRQALSPLLEQAFAGGTMWNTDLAALAQRPALQKALRVASDTAANEGRPLPMVSLDETGQDVTPAARAAYEGYAAAARPRLDAALGEMLGPDGALATADSLMAQRKALADPLYAQFRVSNVPMSDDLAALLKRPSVQSALPNAERLAQDEGKSIYQAAPGVADEAAPQGEGRPFAPIEAYDEARNAKPVRPDVPRPQTLQDFVKSLGGVQDPKGDLKSMGLTSVTGLVAREGKGLGPDAVRQAAAEAGYLGSHIDDAMSDTTVNDLYDALGSHPVHSVYDQDAAHRWTAFDQLKGEADGQAPRNGGPAAPLRAPLDAGPDAALVRQITPEGWDYVKRALDDKIDTAQRAGSGNEARVYTGLKGELVSALDKAVPVYAQARQAYAGKSDLLKALDQGKAAVAKNVTREQLQREFAALGTDGERSMYRLGAGHGLREMVAQRGDGPNLAAPLVGNQAMRDKLATLAPSPAALSKFNQTVADQTKAFTEAQRPDVRGWKLALDNLAAQARAATGDQAAALGQAHDALANHLRTIPAFARADLGVRAADRGQAAFDVGRKVLRSGDDAPWPGDLGRAFDRLPLEQQALLRAGTRSDIEQRFGQNRNDLSALLRIIGGDNDFNRANMRTLFGPDATARMVGATEREQAFANTRNAIAAGSRTAPMQAGSRAIDDATAARDYAVPKDATLLGLLGHGAEHVVRKGTGLLAAMANDTTRAQLGHLLTATGPELDTIRGGLLGALADRARQASAIRSAIEVPAAVPALVAGRRRGR